MENLNKFIKKVRLFFVVRRSRWSKYAVQVDPVVEEDPVEVDPVSVVDPVEVHPSEV